MQNKVRTNTWRDLLWLVLLFLSEARKWPKINLLYLNFFQKVTLTNLLSTRFGLDWMFSTQSLELLHPRSTVHKRVWIIFCMTTTWFPMDTRLERMQLKQTLYFSSPTPMSLPLLLVHHVKLILILPPNPNNVNWRHCRTVTTTTRRNPKKLSRKAAPTAETGRFVLEIHFSCPWPDYLIWTNLKSYSLALRESNNPFFPTHRPPSIWTIAFYWACWFESHILFLFFVF
jgi:hypothetical protein